MPKASAPFEVKLNTLEAYNRNEEARIGRRSLDKEYHGDLEATSQGEMPSAMTAMAGSAGYVAIERVTGSLGGRAGSFTLQHNATMTRGAPTLNIIVVPDSGTGSLEGLTGQMDITIAPGGKHSYTFVYVLPATG